jgi:hypothetical protein
MQWAFGTGHDPERNEAESRVPSKDPQVKPQDPSASLRATLLRRGQGFVEPRLAAIRSIFVDDPALGSFIDS